MKKVYAYWFVKFGESPLAFAFVVVKNLLLLRASQITRAKLGPLVSASAICHHATDGPHPNLLKRNENFWDGACYCYLDLFLAAAEHAADLGIAALGVLSQ